MGWSHQPAWHVKVWCVFWAASCQSAVAASPVATVRCSVRPLIFWCLRHVWLSKDMEKRSPDLTALIWASLNPAPHDRNFMSFVSLVLRVHRRTLENSRSNYFKMEEIHSNTMFYWGFPCLLPCFMDFTMTAQGIHGFKAYGGHWLWFASLLSQFPTAMMVAVYLLSCMSFLQQRFWFELRKARLPMLEMPICPRTVQTKALLFSWPYPKRSAGEVTWQILSNFCTSHALYLRYLYKPATPTQVPLSGSSRRCSSPSQLQRMRTFATEITSTSAIGFVDVSWQLSINIH